MKSLISNMVDRFQCGTLSRRELVQGLTLLVAVGAASAEEAPAASALSATGVDHVSVLVSDLDRSAKFYQGLFGLSLVSEDKEHGILRLGHKRAIVSIRKEQPYGTVDHFAIAVDNFDKAAVSQVLSRRGLAAKENWQYGFHTHDPDGMNVQIV